MNERIRELIKQATEVRQPAPHSNQTENSIVFNKEKFAELLVRECAGVAWGIYANQEIANGIKQHFGVE